MFRYGWTVLLITATAAVTAANAQKKYAPGVTDTEIKIGQTVPYSGPVSMWGVNGQADTAFFRMINDLGGVNGRKIKLISLDDGYSPPKTLEQTRKLVEDDNVAFIYRSLGTATNTAVAKYLNAKKVPQLLIASGASKWNDPDGLPWTVSSMMSYLTEAHLYGRFLLANKPKAKIAVLYQNDDLGKDFYKGVRESLGVGADTMIVKALSTETSDPTVDTQIVELQAAGADTLFLFTNGKQSAQAIRKAYDLGWRPTTFLASFSAQIGATLALAGLDKSTGIITAQFYKDATDPQWKDDAEFKAWSEWMDKYNPGADRTDFVYVGSYAIGSLLVQIIKAAGDDLTRENIMAQAEKLDKFRMPLTLPGLTVSTSPRDHRPLKQGQLSQFDGKQFVPIGELLSD
jgi:branched-chain amino acid transport system substrate-binding protein